MLIITIGLPGCGKSTWAKEVVEGDRKAGVVTTRVNRDLIRTMLHFDEWSKENEKLTVQTRDILITSLLAAGNVICDDTNLDPKVREELTNLGRTMGHAVLVKDFRDVPLHVCIDRDADRTGKARVGSQVILRMHERYMSVDSK